MIESIRLRLVNDPITTLLFGLVQKYYDGSVALYIYFVCYLAIPKFLFFFFQIKKQDFFIFIFFHNINIVKIKSSRCENKKVCDAEIGLPIDRIKSEMPFISYYSFDT